MFHRGIKILISILFLISPLELRALVNGKPLIATPDVVRIVFSNGWMCSGVFIDKWTILTAAHCLQKPSDDAEFKIDKILTENDEALSIHQIQLISHPSYAAQSWHSFDLGVIKTTENLRYQGKFHLEQTKSSSGHIVFMGTGKYDLEKNLRARLMGENSFFSIGSILFFLGKASNTSDEAGQHTTIAPNDSGGPIIDPQTNSIIGVMSTTTVRESAKYGLPALSTGTSTVTKENLDFLLSHLGSAN